MSLIIWPQFFCALTYICESSDHFFFLLLYENPINYDFITMEL